MRLKAKLGDHSNASSEVRIIGGWAGKITPFTRRGCCKRAVCNGFHSIVHVRLLCCGCAQVEYNEAVGMLVGREGRGIATIMDMVVHTRLDCALGSAALMRQGVRMAAHHAAQRVAFGAKLIDQPLMLAVLADMAVESEAATAMVRAVQTHSQHNSPLLLCGFSRVCLISHGCAVPRM